MTPWIEACQAPVSSTISQSWLKFMSTELLILSNHLILCRSSRLCLQSFPASGSFPMSWLFTAGGQSTSSSASATALPVNIQDWFPLGLTDLISLQSKGLSRRVLFSTTVQMHQFFETQPSLWTNSHIHTWLLERKHSFDYIEFCQQSDVFAFNTLSRFASFPSREQASFNFMAEVTIRSDFWAHEMKICYCFHFSPLLFAIKW